MLDRGGLAWLGRGFLGSIDVLNWSSGLRFGRARRSCQGGKAIRAAAGAIGRRLELLSTTFPRTKHDQRGLGIAGRFMRLRRACLVVGKLDRGPWCARRFVRLGGHWSAVWPNRSARAGWGSVA
jgi:hypothetical protein